MRLIRVSNTLELPLVAGCKLSDDLRLTLSASSPMLDYVCDTGVPFGCATACASSTCEPAKLSDTLEYKVSLTTKGLMVKFGSELTDFPGMYNAMIHRVGKADCPLLRFILQLSSDIVLGVTKYEGCKNAKTRRCH